MAGTLFGIGMSQQFYLGSSASGALLYIYAANTSTPASTYSDFGLTLVQTFPIVADGDGRLPPLWVADGSYRARLTTSAGIVIFDVEAITSIGASVTSGGGSSGGGASVDPTTVFGTGDFIWVPVSGTRTGWVRANARTIGSGASSGVERANADTQALFEYLWATYSNTICPVGSGRGASAAADFNANKSIATPDMRGCAGAGLDDMGNSTAGIIAGGTPTTPATGGGAETTTLAQGNVPSYNLVTSGLTLTANSDGVSIKEQGYTLSGGATEVLVPGTGGSKSSGNTGGGTLSGTLSSGGSGTAFNKMSPYKLGTWYIKL